jgi:hypothetical protein
MVVESSSRTKRATCSSDQPVAAVTAVSVSNPAVSPTRRAQPDPSSPSALPPLPCPLDPRPLPLQENPAGHLAVDGLELAPRDQATYLVVAHVPERRDPVLREQLGRIGQEGTRRLCHGSGRASIGRAFARSLGARHLRRLAARTAVV